MNREVRLCTTRPVNNGLTALNTDVIILAFTRLSSAELPVLITWSCYCLGVLLFIYFSVVSDPHEPQSVNADLRRG